MALLRRGLVGEPVRILQQNLGVEADGIFGRGTEAALIEYQRVIETAFREVSDALVQHQKVREIRAEQERLVETLRDRSRLSYIRYRGGVDTLLNALDADRDLFDAELGLAQTRRNELLALVQLYRALGGGWQQ